MGHRCKHLKVVIVEEEMENEEEWLPNDDHMEGSPDQ